MSGNGNACTSWTLARARPKMENFVAKMRATGNVYLSCKAAGIPRSTAYYWRNKFKTFADEWNEAKEDAVDKLDAEAWDRATNGQSDRLLMFLLQAHRPSVYKPITRLSHEGTGEGGAIKIDDASAKYHAQSLAALADSLRGLLVDGRETEPGDLDATEQAAMGRGAESGG